MHARIRIMRLYAMILYTSVNASAYRALPKHNELFHFSMARFSKRLKQFHSTLLPYTATMVWTSLIPPFSFWDQSYWFAPNSKLQSATEDRRTHERVELSQRKYQGRRLFSLNIASLVAEVQPVLWLIV